MSSANSGNLTSCFPICLSFVFIFSLTQKLWLKFSRTILSNSSKSGYVVWFQSLAFPPFNTESAVGLSWPSLCWAMFLLYIICLRLLSWNDVVFYLIFSLDLLRLSYELEVFSYSLMKLLVWVSYTCVIQLPNIWNF